MRIISDTPRIYAPDANKNTDNTDYRQEDTDYNRLLMVNQLQSELIDVQDKIAYKLVEKTMLLIPKKPELIGLATTDNVNILLTDDLVLLNAYITELIGYRTKSDKLNNELSDLRRTKNKLKHELYYIQPKKWRA